VDAARPDAVAATFTPHCLVIAQGAADTLAGMHNSGALIMRYRWTLVQAGTWLPQMYLGVWIGHGHVYGMQHSPGLSETYVGAPSNKARVPQLSGIMQ
jgi:hypothetical protein